MLPTVPMLKAIPLCTAPMSVPAPKRGINAAAITRNIIEKLVPMPPGICRESVRMFAAGTISFFANIPRSQHNAIKIRLLNLDLSMFTPFQHTEGTGVSARTPVSSP